VEVTVATQNVTLALPKELLREARLLAVARGTSLSALLAEQLRRAVHDDDAYEAARRRIRRRLRRGFDLGTRGGALPRRGDLHER
jgi:hypothetical protein